MKKYLFLAALSTFTLSEVWADSTDAFTAKALAFCKSQGGIYRIVDDMKLKGDKYCRTVECKQTTSERFEIPPDSKDTEGNVEAVTTVCIPKSEIDGQFDRNAGADGKGKGKDSDDSDSDGKGKGKGKGRDSDSAGSGSTGGNGNGSNGGNGNSIVCQEIMGTGRIEEGAPCYDECKSKYYFLQGDKKGFEREECVKCVRGHSDLYQIDERYLPKDKHGDIAGTVSFSGLTGVHTGKIVCKDSNGNVVTIDGSACPSGSTIHVGGTGSGSGSLGISISDATRFNGGGSGRGRSDRYRCSVGSDERDCLGDDYYYEMSSRSSSGDCVNCQRGSRGDSSLSGVAEIIGALAPPLAQVGVAAIGAVSSYNNNQLWANATIKGYEQCRASKQDYLNHIADYRASLATNEQPALTSDQEAQLMGTANCNGFGANSYAGLGPNYNNYYNAGYSPGYINGMNGPYATPFPPYNTGIAGNIYGGVYGGGPGNIYGGAGNIYGGVYGGGAGNIYGGVYGGGAGNIYGGAGNIYGGVYGGGAGNIYGGVGGIYAGYAPNGYNNGYNGGCSMYGCGGPNSGVAQWGNQYGNNYWGQTGGWNGGNPQADYNASMYASGQDRMLQQRGGAYQMSNGNYGNGFNAGAAGYQPANLGFGLNGGFSFGV